MRLKHTDVIRSLAEYETAITNHLDQAEIDRLHSHKQSLAVSYQAELKLYEECHRLLQNELALLTQRSKVDLLVIDFIRQHAINISTINFLL